MREIKFRGKRKDNGEWVYGSLVNNFWANSKTKSPVCEIFTPALEDGDCWDDYVADENSVVEVHTESVGQFTGLKDKNGKEIYEGDILTSTLGNGLPCQIKFGEFHDDAERDFDNITFIGFYFHEQTGERTAFGKSIYGNTECFEIIGNIYENPELLTP